MLARALPVGTRERLVSVLAHFSRRRCTRVEHFISVLDASLGEILTTAAKLDWLLDHGTRVLRPETRHSSLLTIYKHSEVHFEPLGVVAALVSWNYRTLYAHLSLLSLA